MNRLDSKALPQPAPVVLPAHGTAVIEAAEIYAGPQTVFRPGVLTLRNGRVAAVALTGALETAGPDQYLPNPNEPIGPVFRFPQARILPGFIDGHVHLALDPGDGLDGPLARAARGRRWGLAGVRDGGDRTGRVLDEKPGIQTYLALASGGTALYAPGRYGAFLGQAAADRQAMARAVVHWAGRGADFIKVLASGPVDLDRSGHVGPPQFRFEDLSYLVELAKNQGLGVMAHANGPHAVAEAVRAGAATVEHGYFMGEDNLKRLADQGIPWIPTVVPLAVLEAREPDPERQRRIGDIVRRQLDQAAQAEALGVPLILGTDAGCPGVAVGPGLYMEMSLWLSAGIRAETVLDAAVYRPAHLFGWDLDLGRLEPGSRALLTGYDAGRPLAETLSIPPLWVSRLEPAPQG